MKKLLVTGIILFACHCGMAQIAFEPGYFISADGKRTECQIKNLDWKSNPTSFEYRVNGTDGKGDIETIAEFGITGGSVFRKFTVQVDQSTDNIQSLGPVRNPDFKKETAFLRLLVNGKAVLYMYDDHGLIRFFYNVDGSSVSQLVYKRYLQRTEKGFETGKAAENEQYKQQLLNELKCSSISQNDVERLKYERATLMKFFDRYNECTGSTVQTNEEVTVPSPTHISFLAGVGFNSFSYSNSSTITDIASAPAFRVGAELEIVLPFNKGMWSVTLQPIYQTWSSKDAAATISVNYSSLDLGLGLRRYLFIEDQNSMYANLGAVYGLPISGAGAIKGPTSSLDISSGINVVFGVGYRFSKFSGELSYGFKRGLLGDYLYYSSNYSGVIVTLGYRIK